MKKNFTILFILMFFGVSSAFTQVIVSQEIDYTNINLTNVTNLGQVTINPTEAGQVIVHFDGYCMSDDGDLIVLAASNTTSWGSHDQCVIVEAPDSDVSENSFSHTRVYNVNAGSYTYYAVAQNYLETAGTGIASISGTLTAKFIPSGASYLAGFQTIYQSAVDLANETTLGQVTINPTEAGKVIVRFDGRCSSDVGDRIYLAASNTTSWGINDGSVSVEASSANVNENSFSHTRVYDVTAGSYTYYAVAQNYSETDGSGIASIYGSLTVEFIPAVSYYLIGFQGISQPYINLADTILFLGEVTINPTVAGTAMVHFDGRCISDVGDRIILAASNTTFIGIGVGCVYVQASNADVNRKPFSHTMVYDNVLAGSKTFRAIAQYDDINSDGSGFASIDGSLTVTFFPNVGASVESNMMNPLQIYPVPASDFITVVSETEKIQNYSIYDVSGRLLLYNDLSAAQNPSHQIDVSVLATGVYFIKVQTKNQQFTKKILIN